LTVLMELSFATSLARMRSPQPLRPHCFNPVLHFLGQLRVEVEAGLPLDLPNACLEL